MRRVILLLSLFCLLSSAFCGARAEEESEPLLILRYADNQPESHPASAAARYFSALVENRSRGAICIDVFLNGELGTEAHIIDLMRFGGVDFSRFSLGTLSDDFPQFAVLFLPYLYRDGEHMWRVLESRIGDQFLYSAEGSNMIGLAWLDAGARSFYTTTPVETVSDLEGLKIRALDTDMMESFLRPFGVIPEKLTYSDVYSAIQRGLIDGAENNIPSYYSKEHYQVAPYLYLDEHMRVPEIMMMSKVAKNRIEALGGEYLEIVKECAREAAQYERRLWLKAEAESLEAVGELGVTVIVPSAEDKEELRRLSEVLYEEYSQYESIIDSIREM